jgi:hypothetical protein
MKISVTPTAALERPGLFQKLRLRRASVRHGARVTLAFNAQDLPQLVGLDRRILSAWAGPSLSDLVGEIARAGRSATPPAEVTIAKPVADPQAVAALSLRAEIFGQLVRFGIAERRLAGAGRAQSTRIGDATI